MLRYAGILNSAQIFTEEFFLTSILREGKEYRVFSYTPMDPEPEKLPGILLIHGLSARGIEDERIVELARNLSSLGFVVFTPELEEITQLQIIPESIENITDCILSIKHEPHRFAVDRLGFFSVSLSGGMGLVALADSRVQGLVNAALILGAYSDFETVIPYVLEHFEEDNYAGLVLLYNYLDRIQDVSPELKKFLFVAALDNGLRRGKGELEAPELWQNLEDEDKGFIKDFFENSLFRKELGEKIQKSSPELLRELSPIYFLDHLKLPLAILHGESDAVLSEKESIQLAIELKKRKTPFLLEITGLLSHGDTLPMYKQLKEVPGLANGFGYFFTNLSSKNTIG